MKLSLGSDGMDGSYDGSQASPNLSHPNDDDDRSSTAANTHDRYACPGDVSCRSSPELADFDVFSPSHRDDFIRGRTSVEQQQSLPCLARAAIHDVKRCDLTEDTVKLLLRQLAQPPPRLPRDRSLISGTTGEGASSDCEEDTQVGSGRHVVVADGVAPNVVDFSIVSPCADSVDMSPDSWRSAFCGTTALARGPELPFVPKAMSERILQGVVCPDSERRYTNHHVAACPVCGLLMSAPTTLACGHSTCVTCFQHLASATNTVAAEEHQGSYGNSLPDSELERSMSSSPSGSANAYSTGSPAPGEDRSRASRTSSPAADFSQEEDRGRSRRPLETDISGGTAVCPIPGCNCHVDLNSVVINNSLANVLSNWFPRQACYAENRRRARILLDLAQYGDAITSLGLAVAEDASRPEPHAQLAHCYSRLGRLEEALQEADVACRLQPLCPHYHLQRAEVLQAVGRHGDALRDIVYGVGRLGSVNGDTQDLLSTVLFTWVSSQHERPVAEQVTELVAILSSHQPAILHDLTATVRLAALSRSSAAAEGDGIAGDSEAVVPLELESPPESAQAQCPVCLKILFKPITTPCGHMYCESCITCNLDYTNTCPMCRHDLGAFCASLPQPATKTMVAIAEAFRCEMYGARQTEHDTLMEGVFRPISSEQADISVFVCTLAVPSTTVRLHIFEPRYRLMVRRVLESGSGLFGMCAPMVTSTGHMEGYRDFGTVLTIDQHRRANDGRYHLTCIGSRRFRVLRRYTLNGYDRAEVEWISDASPPESEMEELIAYHDAVYTMARKFFNEPAIHQFQRYLGTLPEAPTGEQLHVSLQSSNGPDWVWYCIHALPVASINNSAIYEAVASPRLSDRLSVVRTFLLQPNCVLQFSAMLYIQLSNLGEA